MDVRSQNKCNQQSFVDYFTYTYLEELSSLSAVLSISNRRGQTHKTTHHLLCCFVEQILQPFISSHSSPPTRGYLDCFGKNKLATQMQSLGITKGKLCIRRISSIVWCLVGIRHLVKAKPGKNYLRKCFITRLTGNKNSEEWRNEEASFD